MDTGSEPRRLLESAGERDPAGAAVEEVDVGAERCEEEAEVAVACADDGDGRTVAEAKQLTVSFSRSTRPSLEKARSGESDDHGASGSSCCLMPCSVAWKNSRANEASSSTEASTTSAGSRPGGVGSPIATRPAGVAGTEPAAGGGKRRRGRPADGGLPPPLPEVLGAFALGVEDLEPDLRRDRVELGLGEGDADPVGVLRRVQVVRLLRSLHLELEEGAGPEHAVDVADRAGDRLGEGDVLEDDEREGEVDAAVGEAGDIGATRLVEVDVRAVAETCAGLTHHLAGDVDAVDGAEDVREASVIRPTPHPISRAVRVAASRSPVHRSMSFPTVVWTLVRPLSENSASSQSSRADAM